MEIRRRKAVKFYNMIYPEKTKFFCLNFIKTFNSAFSVFFNLSYYYSRNRLWTCIWISHTNSPCPRINTFQVDSSHPGLGWTIQRIWYNRLWFLSHPQQLVEHKNFKIVLNLFRKSWQWTTKQGANSSIMMYLNFLSRISCRTRFA